MKTGFLAVSVLLSTVLTIALASNSKDSDARARGVPRVVASVQLKNQTAQIPTTTIFTPDRDGLFRISAYMDMTTSGNTNNFWYLDFDCTDEAGPQTYNQLLTVQDVSSLYGGTIQGGFPLAVTFRAIAGHPVTYDTSFGGTPANGAYQLYLLIEQLPE
jgi:hypothetical protein